MKGERFAGIVRNLVQGAEIIGGTLLGISYILTHPDEAMPEGGWKEDQKVKSIKQRGHQRLTAVSKLIDSIRA